MLIDGLHPPQRTIRLRLAVGLVAGGALLLALVAQLAGAQSRAHAAEVPAAPASGRGGGHTVEDNVRSHMEMTPSVRPAPGDSARAAAVVKTLRAALMKYRDTTAAVADGYRMFMPQVKEQKVYHFTNNWRAVQEAFRFEPARPTSILYRKGPDGKFELVGAMYTAPKRFGFDKLDARVPLSVAHWHKHVNWCLPKRNERQRWLERQNGEPTFGPQSPIASKEACDLVGGVFHATIFGWMLHANVFTGDDPAVIWGDDHSGHDAHGMMKMDGT